MKSFRFPLALLLAAVALPATAAESFTVDARHTFPVFEVGHLGFSTQRGRFNKTSGKIVLDRSAGTGSLDIRIEAASVSMGLEDWDKHMRGEDFFDADQHPYITYKADKILFSGDKPVAAEGMLTLRGVTKPVRLEISAFNCGTHPLNRKPLCGADVSTRFKRSDFGMYKYTPGVSDEVKVMIAVEAFRD